MQLISISMISRATNVFAARLVRHRPVACEFSRGQFDVWPCILVIINNNDPLQKQKQKKQKRQKQKTKINNKNMLINNL